ncbi:hypothetical protein L1049_024959 [Liquidambar formosana]|uniref:Uncharacterized protein n=1 Tax=Liquidambar formosana TaxID=63359 RepID=A0AAP0WYU8_LIQFO
MIEHAVGESQPTNKINQTDLQVAMADMRTRSYYRFIILLKILNSSPNWLQSGDITFLMPNDPQLSEAAVTPDHLQDFNSQPFNPYSFIDQQPVMFSDWNSSSFKHPQQDDQCHQQWKSKACL